MKTLVALLVSINVAVAMDITICNCSEPTTNRILKLIDDECVAEDLISFENVSYEITTVNGQRINFTGHFCAVSTKLHASSVLPDTTEVDKLTPLSPRPKIGSCLIMAGLGDRDNVHKCPNREIMHQEGDKWIGRSAIQRNSRYMQTVGHATETCLYEQITLTKDCADCPISTPVGPIGNVDQVETKNGTMWFAALFSEGTMMWKGKEGSIEKCNKTTLEFGEGRLYRINNETFRLADPSKQLDFIISKEIMNGNDCNVSLTENQFWIIQMPGIYVTIKRKSSEPSRNVFTTTRSPVNSQPEVASRPARALVDSLNAAEHLQFIQNRLTDNENKLLSAVRQLQCESRKNKFQRAIRTAASNGWIAAKELGFPKCTRLIPVGETAQMQTCSPQTVEVTSLKTTCGPQPLVYENYTVSINGFELTKFSDCYHQGKIVNLNGRPFSFIDNDWKELDQNIVPNEKGIVNINEFAYEADNSLDVWKNIDSDKSNVYDHMSILADIVAVINEHEPDNFIGRPHPSKALIDKHEHENHTFLQTIATWLQYFGGITLLALGIFIAYRLFGGQAVVKKALDFIGLPTWATGLISCDLFSMCKKKKEQPNEEVDTEESFTVIDLESEVLDTDQDGKRRSRPSKKGEKRSKGKSRRRNHSR